MPLNSFKKGCRLKSPFQSDKELPLICELPPFVIVEVIYSEPAVRGDTANSVRKPATIDNGATVTVPSFVEVGTKIKIDTRTGGLCREGKISIIDGI
jgi:elongation factor P